MAKNKQSGMNETETADNKVVILSFDQKQKQAREQAKSTLVRVLKSELPKLDGLVVAAKVESIRVSANTAQEISNKAFATVGEQVAQLQRLFADAGSQTFTAFLFDRMPYDKCGFQHLSGISGSTAKAYLSLHHATQALPLYVPDNLIQAIKARFGSAFKQVAYGKAIAFLNGPDGKSFCDSHKCENPEDTKDAIRDLVACLKDGRNRESKDSAKKLSEYLYREYGRNGIGQGKATPPKGSKKRLDWLLDVERLVDDLNQFKRLFPQFAEMDIEVTVSYKSTKLSDEIADLTGKGKASKAKTA